MDRLDYVDGREQGGQQPSYENPYAADNLNDPGRLTRVLKNTIRTAILSICTRGSCGSRPKWPPRRAGESKNVAKTPASGAILILSAKLIALSASDGRYHFCPNWLLEIKSLGAALKVNIDPWALDPDTAIGSPNLFDQLHALACWEPVDLDSKWNHK